jgi:hypothetical protein
LARPTITWINVNSALYAYSLFAIDLSMRGARSETAGDTRARYFPPETGGLIRWAESLAAFFQIDHDQAYQQNAVFATSGPQLDLLQSAL